MSEDSDSITSKIDGVDDAKHNSKDPDVSMDAVYNVVQSECVEALYSVYNMFYVLRHPISFFVIAVAWQYVVGHLMGYPIFGPIALIVTLSDSLRMNLAAIGWLFGTVSGWPEALRQLIRWMGDGVLFDTIRALCREIHVLACSPFAFAEGYRAVIDERGWSTEGVVVGSIIIITVLFVVLSGRIARFFLGVPLPAVAGNLA